MVNEPGKKIIKIAEKFLYPQYDSPDRANDLALLKLETPATIGDTVSPPCLPQPGDFGDDSSFPAGDIKSRTLDTSINHEPSYNNYRPSTRIACQIVNHKNHFGK